MGRWNSSSHVVKEFGSGSGLSCFHISPVLDSPPLNISDEENQENHALIFERRPDIRLSFAERWSHKYVDEMKLFVKRVSEADIMRCENMSTFIPALDAFRNCQRFDSREDKQLRPKALIGLMEDFNKQETASSPRLAIPNTLHPLLVLALSLEQYCAEWCYITDCQPKKLRNSLLCLVKEVHRSVASTLAKPNHTKLKILNNKFKDALITGKRLFIKNR
jgi:hypothetical protein